MNAPRKKMTLTTSFLRGFWNVASWIGMRRLGDSLKQWRPDAYGDTLFYFERECGNAPALVVALTIDDGLCRSQDAGKSMVNAVLQVLKEYEAHATFFVCSDYTHEEDARKILQAGHEFGNHLGSDQVGYYCNLEEAAFRAELLATNTKIQSSLQDPQLPGSLTSKSVTWFRAPQGQLTPTMARVLKEEGFKSVLGDCYCDDWAFAEQNGSTTNIVAPAMLSQVLDGSIAILHMPERGFRESTLDAIREFLEGCRQRGIRCVSLTELTRELR